MSGIAGHAHTPFTHHHPIHMLYINDNIEDINLEEALNRLPSWRREQALGYRRDHDRRLCVAAYMLLWQGLQAEYGMSDAPAFGYAEGGKPFIAGRHDIHFSLSHCRVAALCALESEPVGADIESVRPYNAELARHVMNDDELRQIENAPRPDIAFVRLWTMKESLLKLTGEGIRRELKDVLTDCDKRFSTTVNAARGYVFTICSRK